MHCPTIRWTNIYESEGFYSYFHLYSSRGILTINGFELLADKILLIQSEYPNADLILPGYFNARTKDFMDFIVEDDADYIFGEQTTYPADEFSIPRRNKDSDFSNIYYGVSLMELCCTFNVLNSRLFDNLVGVFTCFANKSTFEVDYDSVNSIISEIY